MIFKPYFQLCSRHSRLAIQSASACWHLRHGIVYNIFMVGGDLPLIAGVFYASQMFESSYCLHFETNRPLPPYFVISAMKKGLKMFVDCFDEVFCTVDCDRVKLLGVVRALGFRDVSELRIRGRRVLLLQYFRDRKIIL